MKQSKFARKKNVRAAFLNSIVEALVIYGRIRTTETRAKAVKPLVEKLVTKARKPGLTATRLLARRLHARALKKIRDEWGPRYQDRHGGYTRITKVPSHRRDGAPMAVIEFV
jgi:large subunit ribosomal protein L17